MGIAKVGEARDTSPSGAFLSSLLACEGRCHSCLVGVTLCTATCTCRAQVVGMSKLRTKYESHEAKRQLCNSYDLFAADERILPSLPKLLGESSLLLYSLKAGHLTTQPDSSRAWGSVPIKSIAAGKSFFKKKKQPVPVRLTGKDWAGQIRKACGATYLFWSGVRLAAIVCPTLAAALACVQVRVRIPLTHIRMHLGCRGQQLDHQSGTHIAGRAAVRGECSGGYRSSH